MKLTITKDEAKFIHQKFYNGDFEVVEIKRSGVFDTPPFSFFTDYLILVVGTGSCRLMVIRSS